MQLLCPLTEWKTERATRGKAVGKDVTSRLVLAAYKWGWAIGTQRGGSDDDLVVGEAFIPSMRLIMKHIYDADCRKYALDQIVASLTKLTGKTAPERGLLLTIKDWESYGRKLDDTYGTSYGREIEDPPGVPMRVFGKQETE